MAHIEEAHLRADGGGADAVLTVELRIDWDRSDRDRRYEVVIRFMGADALVRGADDPLHTHTVPVSPDSGEHVTVRVDNHERRFDEDRGDDEVLALCELVEVQPESRVVKTNTVKGGF